MKIKFENLEAMDDECVVLFLTPTLTASWFKEEGIFIRLSITFLKWGVSVTFTL